MKSKTSYFSVSGTLIKENMRRFWVIPLLGFLTYFLSGVLPILMTYRDLNPMFSYISLCLHNQQPFFVIANVTLPIACAAYVFRYLQTTSSSTALHAMPFTRAKLFNSNVISGLTLSVIPVLLTGLILLAIHKPVYPEWSHFGSIGDYSDLNVFTTEAILHWMGVSLAVIFFTYALSVLAGILTGNTVMQILASFGLSFIVPALYLLGSCYADIYLYGYDTRDSWDLTVDLCPIVRSAADQGNWLFYGGLIFVLGLIILAVSSVFYHKRKLEHAADSIAFRFLEPVVCWLVAFLGMTMLGFYFGYLHSDSEELPNLLMYFGFAAGAILFFAIGLIIVKKSARIFNKKNLKSFLLFCLAALLFFLALNLDIIGYEKRVPNSDKVASASFLTNFGSFWNDGNSFSLEDPENIKRLAEFHRSITANKELFENSGDHFAFYVDLTYKCSPFDMRRSYPQISYEFLAGHPMLKEIMESKEYKCVTSFYVSTKAQKLDSVTLFPCVGSSLEIRDSAEVKAFIDCLNEDYKNMTFEQLTGAVLPVCEISVNYYTKEDLKETDTNSSTDASLTKYCTKTINWLKEKGYWEQINVTAADFDYAEVIRLMQDKDGISSEKTLAEITESAKIQQILEQGQSFPTKDEYYIIRLYSKARQPEPSSEYYKEENTYDGQECYDVYFDAMPDFLGL